MFYEEKVIDGELMFRTTPGGLWSYVPRHVLTDRVLRAEAGINRLAQRIDEMVEQFTDAAAARSIQ